MWTEDRVETLKQMWAECKSATDIARVLNCGITRNGVIGKARRLGLLRSDKGTEK